MDCLNQSSDQATHTTTATTTATTFTTPQGTTTFTPFRFLDLPAELRIDIYEHLVAIGKVFYTPDAYAIANEVRFKDWKYDDFDGLDSAGRMQHAHAVFYYKLELAFHKMIQGLSGYFKVDTFRYLEIDLTDDYCPRGCCPVLSHSWGQLLSIGLPEISFVGIRDAQERVEVMNSIVSAPEFAYLRSRVDNSVDKEIMEKLGIVFNLVQPLGAIEDR